MKPRPRTARWHLLLQNSCYSADSLMRNMNLIILLLCLLVFVVHKGRIIRESRNNVGTEESGPLFLCLNCRLSSENRPESRSLVQLQPHGWSWLWRLGGKVNLRQTDTQRTRSQVVRETTALTNQKLCHSAMNICTD